MTVDTHLLRELRARGLVAQMTGEDKLAQWLQESRTLYCGFDPTADSLHIGSLVPLLTLKRFQLAGHKPIALVGGATGLIGDPSFKAQERQLNTAAVVADWVQKLQSQIAEFIDFSDANCGAEVVNNLEWMQQVNVLDFLRDIGKHFSVNNMVNKESVKQRLHREGEGISFTEFSYMILQSYDFAELFRRYNCSVQIGGSDQWGNITGGVDLARRLHGGHVFGLTLPLVTKADGEKFGKTASGSVWLDAAKTSPYMFYQFWLSTADSDVYKFLRYFTFLSLEQIADIEAQDQANQGRPQAQSVLAKEVTELVHGKEGLVAAQRITQSMFSGDWSEISEADLMQLKLDGLPSSDLLEQSNLAEKPLTTLLTEMGMVKAGREVKDALGRGAVVVNGEVKHAEDNLKAHEIFAREKSLYGRYFLIKLGKKKNHLVELI